MITPIELQSKSFKTGIGYDKKDVENFMNSLHYDYETLYKDNIELNDKLNVLTEGLNYFKTIEKTLQKALVLAEQTAENTREAAIKLARSIEEEANGKAKLLVADANNDLHRIQQKTIQLIMQYDAYKAQFKHLAAAQCEFLESDSFQIHIANFDTFTVPDEIEANIKKENKSKTSAELGDEEPKKSDEDFEFYHINVDGQE